MVRFWRLLSQNYQSLLPLDPYPTYSRAAIDESFFQPGDEARFYPMFPQLLTRNPKPPPLASRITLFFAIDQLRVVQEALSVQGPDEPILRLSLQDCVTALVSVACSKANVENQPLDRIVNVFNVRPIMLSRPVSHLIGTRRVGTHRRAFECTILG